MAEKTRNLCAEIPLELHTKVRQRQAESGETLSRYMTALITKYYEMESCNHPFLNIFYFSGLIVCLTSSVFCFSMRFE